MSVKPVESASRLRMWFPKFHRVQKTNASLLENKELISTLATIKNQAPPSLEQAVKMTMKLIMDVAIQ